MSKQKAFYNNGSGLGIGPLPGPYSYKGDITVYPLRANQASIQKFVNEYINDIGLPSWVKFEAIWDWIFLFVAEVELEQGGSKIGAEKYTSLFFRVPVYTPLTSRKEGGELTFLEIFSFIDSIPAVLTSREARGLNSRYANFGLPSIDEVASNLPADLVRGFGHVYDPSEPVRIENLRRLKYAPDSGRKAKSISLLAMVTKVADEVGVTAEARDEVLLLIRSLNSSDIRQHKDEKPLADLKSILATQKALRYCDRFDHELQRRVPCKTETPSSPPGERKERISRGNALDEIKEDEEWLFGALFDGLLGRQVQRVYTIKQFSDASDGLKASYQALVRIDHFFTGEVDGEDQPDVKVSKSGCIVRVYDYASHPINKIFKFPAAYRLRPTASVSESYCGCPVYVRGCKLVEERGRTLFYRSQDGEWFDTGEYNKGSGLEEEAYLITKNSNVKV